MYVNRRNLLGTRRLSETRRLIETRRLFGYLRYNNYSLHMAVNDVAGKRVYHV